MAISKRKKEKASARNANHDINRFPPTEPLTRSKADRKNKDNRYKLDYYFSANLYVHKGYMSSFIPLQKILIKKISLFHPAKEECKNRSPFKCIPRLIVDNPQEERRSRCTQNVCLQVRPHKAALLGDSVVELKPFRSINAVSRDPCICYIIRGFPVS